jgi:calcineurin-like phosphoesterase family protein
MKVKVISDTHFGHEKLLEFRGFSSVKQMNEAIINKWNELIGKDDKVIHLGDFAVGMKEDEIESIITRLNGKITLILGNHDTFSKLKNVYIKHFRCLSSLYAPPYYFTHEPINNECLQEQITRVSTINVHGHLHTAKYLGNAYINMNYDVVGLNNMVKEFEIEKQEKK